ncbi:MAG: putative manganese transporter [Tissierellia bacterium]|nr:putative manganese transporter [Tissierellia bacterium]MDD4780377.1 putative manganese transporter [Tissierellia bacterium]
MIDIIIDTLLDSIRTLPFLFAAYLFIEYIEHKSSDKIINVLKKYGTFGGALLGCIPQCGFSVAASNLYAGRIITKGTLIAVFISTSDEAVPVLLSSPGNFGTILNIIAFKIVIALIAGFLIDLILKKNVNNKVYENYNSNNAMSHMCSDCGCNDHSILKPAIKHTLSIFVFMILTTFIINLIINSIGEENLSTLLLSNSIYQPAIAAIIGFIPNCASSVILTQLYLSGALSFGSIIAGLSTGAGVGLLVLFKANNDVLDNIKIIVYMYIVSVISGTLIQLII